MNPMNRRHFITSSAATLAAGALLSRTAVAAPVASATADGGSYAPKGVPRPVVKPGEFVMAAAHLDHGHIYGECNGLTEAGATLKWVYEPDEKKRTAFQAKFPSAKTARSLQEILDDPEVRLVAAAAVTSERGPLGCQVMEGGKDYFTDKAPFTTLEQLDQAKAVVARTGRKYFVYYSERIHVEAAMYATDLVQAGVLGRVISVIGLGPHRLNKATRPDWFFERAKFGGILCDIGSHQFEQFLTYASAHNAEVVHAAIGNFANPDKPEFEDFGEATLIADNGATNQVRVDWFTPDGLSTWGDGRTFILGTKAYIELRKYVDVGREKTGDQVYLVDDKGEHHLPVAGQVGFRFFGEFILDCMNRTERAMTQAHAFKAAELCLRAQVAARRLT
jgi:predicted dehydrogenase